MKFTPMDRLFSYSSASAPKDEEDFKASGGLSGMYGSANLDKRDRGDRDYSHANSASNEPSKS